MEQVEKLLKSDDRITAALAAAATESGTKFAAAPPVTKQIRRQSTVTFSNVVVENGTKVDLIPEEECTPESPLASPKIKTSRRPITRIPTEIKLKTITHKVKRPAVDIEFHDLVYTVKTATGEYNEYVIL